jgi:hypothetical protein
MQTKLVDIQEEPKWKVKGWGNGEHGGVDVVCLSAPGTGDDYCLGRDDLQQ